MAQIHVEFIFFRARCQPSTDGGKTCPVLPRDNLTDVKQKGNQCYNDPIGRISKGSDKRIFKIQNWHALCCVCVGVNAVAIPITIFVVPWLVG